MFSGKKKRRGDYQNMEYVMAAVAIAPIVADTAAVVSTVRSTVQTARWVGSWAMWAMGRDGKPKADDDAWLFVDDDESVTTEVRFISR